MGISLARRVFYLALILYTASLVQSQSSYVPVPDCDAKPATVNFESKPGHCTWMGQCVANKATNGMFNCYYNGPAKNVSTDNELLKLLNKTCPSYVKGPQGRDTKVCCDVAQLKELETQTGVARSLFSRCPACIDNFMKHFCFTTCDPDMSLYIEPFMRDMPISTVMDCTLKNGTNVTFLEQVNVVIDEDYGSKLFNSCANVEYPEQSGKVISLMCGSAEVCSAPAWLEFLGDPGEDYNEAPFLMQYTFAKKAPKKSMKPFNTNLTKCDTKGKLQCSCSDCPSPEVCPALPASEVPDHFFEYVIYGIAGASLLLTLLCFLITMTMALMQQFSQKDYSPVQREGHHDDEDINSSSTGSLNDDHSEGVAQEVDPLCCGLDYLYGKVGYPLVQVGAWMEFIIKALFYRWGIVATLGSFIVLPAVLVIFGGLSVGIMKFKLTTDPVQLWSAPNSQARLEKNYFDDNFGPFYRTAQVIIRPKGNVQNYSMTMKGETQETDFGPIFQRDILFEVFHLQDDLAHLTAHRDDGSNVTLSDICFKPLSPDNNNCTIQSVLNYFQNNFTRLNYSETDDFGIAYYNASSHISYCARNPTATKGKYATQPEGQIPCLAEYGGPIDPNIALGGFPNDSYNLATAMLVTFIVNNHVNDADNQDAKLWEKEFLNYLKAYKGVNITVAFIAERAITDEIERESSTDEITIIISYLMMFVYIAIFLGRFHSIYSIVIDLRTSMCTIRFEDITRILVDLKIVLGLCGVLIVLLAVAASVGFLSLFGIEGSLIILEVVPFLVLAVGVDNLFILVHSYEREARAHATLPVYQVVARALAEVGPSLILTATSESAAFLLGAISTMPAVRSFSLYAGVAVFFNFLLQISAFVSVMYFDAWRTKLNAIDVLWFIRLPKSSTPSRNTPSLLKWLIRKFYSRLVLARFFRPFVLLFFGLTFTASLALFPGMKVGLDQNLALPKDSYLQDYFTDLYKYLHVGAPVYFVIKDGINYTSTKEQDKICSGSFCDKYSVGTQIAVAARAPEITRIAEPGSIWLDSYYEWLDPSSPCCGHVKGDPTHMCDDPSDESNSTCVHCLPSDAQRPSSEDFLRYLEPFFTANPTTKCAAAGHGAYNSAVVIDYESKNKDIKASYIMTFHSICSTSDDFVAALKEARKIADNLTLTAGVEVFPYSVFYVYYDQYLHTYRDMLLNIGVSIGAVFLVATAMLGLNVWGAFMVIVTVVMILVHLIGVMVLADINANAVSLVNLVMTVGIAVEFSAHIVRWFISCRDRNRLERARSALSNMGSSVVSGIAITKFLGVFILAFAKSQLFFVYYFQMYLSMVIIGALHGLVFLPVMLSYFGPPYVKVQCHSPYPIDPSETRDPPPAPVTSENIDQKYLDEKRHEEVGRANEGLYPTLPSDVPQDYGPPTYPRTSTANEKTPLIH